MTSTEIFIILGIGIVASLTKSITGMGYPLILLPALALFIDVADAVVLVAPSNLLLNGKLSWGLRQERSKAITIPRFLVGGVVGAAIGTMLLPVLPDRVLRLLLIVIIVLFLVNRLLAKPSAMPRAFAERFSVPVGAVAGLFQGAAGISGPIVSPWFLSLDLRRETYIYSVATVFGVVGIVQLALMIVQGLFTTELVALAAVLVPIALLFFPVGERIRAHISVDVFERLILFLLASSAISLLVKVL